MTVPVLPNPTPAACSCTCTALANAPAGPATGADLAALIDRIGFVQVDSINTVERAHHMILFARRPSLPPRGAEAAAGAGPARCSNTGRMMPRSCRCRCSPTGSTALPATASGCANNWRKWFRDGYEAKFDDILNRIARDGPVTSTDVGEGEARGKGGWWDWHPSKTALEWLWRTGHCADHPARRFPEGL